MERPEGEKRIAKGIEEERTAHREEQWKLEGPGGVFERSREPKSAGREQREEMIRKRKRGLWKQKENG